MVELQYNRRAFTAGMATLLLCRVSLDLAHGQRLERSSLKLGVANKSHLYYLPVTIAERRGHFRDYGLAIAMSDFEGGGESLDALLAGSVDVAVGAYEHTLRAQGMGKDV
jgi:NitT/TauT family transport system substrate-binding protein